MAATGWLSWGACFIPYIAPLVATMPALGIAGKYSMTKIEEKGERENLANSLVGILANAQNNNEDAE